MSLLIVGSLAIDSIETPWGKAQGCLGGSATYAALAARLWTPVKVVGIVGTDFPPPYLRLFHRYQMNGPAMEQVPGRTFRWKGRYDVQGSVKTLSLDLGVFSRFRPNLSPLLRRVPFAFLGNIQPSLQWRVRSQLICPRLTACDSRADWIRNERRGLIRVLRQVDLAFLNDSETQLLTGCRCLVEATRALARLGPSVAIVKKGEHGVLAATRDAFFSLPAYPVSKVTDPTGAGDAFAGACLGYLTTQRRMTWASLCRGIQLASAVASLTIEDFGVRGLIQVTQTDVKRRAQVFQTLSRAVFVP